MATIGTRKLKRVVVAMSGGVDSSVAAALLVEQGYEVIGIMLRLWYEPGDSSANRCCTPDAMALARQVANKLGIPFYVIDVQEEFKNVVVDYFINGYTNNITPNPCLVCNREIRWGHLFNRAISIGADFMATGHYARIRNDGEYRLLRANDKSKDQSYVLYILTQDHLARTIFPLGDFTKIQVRELAKRYSLPVASKKDSQDLCFIGQKDYRTFLQSHAPLLQVPGPIINNLGQEIGRHNGLYNFTIGQRKGLGIGAAQPLYVIDKHWDSNTLIVAPKNEIGCSELSATNVNWISRSPPPEPIRAQVKIRYKATDMWGLVTALSQNRINIKFDSELFDITPGQAAVIYDNDICLGGGIIASTIPT